MSETKITLANAIERICTARHRAKWMIAKANELQATRDRIKKGNTTATVDNWIKAQKAAEEIRRPIELEILEIIGTAQLQTFRQLNNGELRAIAPDQWKIFESEATAHVDDAISQHWDARRANRDWPNVTINGKSEIVFLDLDELAGLIENASKPAPLPNHGHRAGENWPIADESIFAKMADEIKSGRSLSNSAAANKFANEAAGTGSPESKARRLRDGYKKWAAKRGS